MNKKSSDTNSALLDSTGELPALLPADAPPPTSLQPLGLPQRRLNAHFYKNAIEPRQLINAFLRHSSPEICTLELSSSRIPGYTAQGELLGYMLASACKFWPGLKRVYKSQFLRKRTLFVGTTATEYLVSPAIENIPALILELKLQMQKRNTDLLVLKDIPEESPLLPREENTQAQKLMQFCEQSGEFSLISGKSLAYFPIDFSNIEEYLAALEPARATDLQNKFKSKENVDVIQLFTGDRFFYDPTVLQELYQLYSNSYEQAQSQSAYTSVAALFTGPKQTPNYFHDLLLDESNCGVVFLYRVQNQLIGFNLSFAHRQNLICKYSGFANPLASKFNLAEVSLLTNLDHACRNDFKFYIEGTLDYEAKSSIGARFTNTRHAVFIANPLLRGLIKSMSKQQASIQPSVAEVQ
ncbi:MAG: GNAT family N-acetyltransferase [Candidatus Obscuribacterales bacterium]|nr:GNAT family N-acetyltransferase [Candidatus Obscuribacterales bacterium]